MPHTRQRSRSLANGYPAYQPQTLPPPPELPMSPKTRQAQSLRVLQRHDPGIEEILDHTYTTLYSYGPDGWEKLGVDGTTFLFEKRGRYGFFILNRSGPSNYSKMFEPDDDMEVSPDSSFVVLQWGPMDAPQQLGMWLSSETKEKERFLEMVARLHLCARKRLPFPESWKMNDPTPAPATQPSAVDALFANLILASQPAVSHRSPETEDPRYEEISSTAKLIVDLRRVGAGWVQGEILPPEKGWPPESKEYFEKLMAAQPPPSETDESEVASNHPGPTQHLPPAPSIQAPSGTQAPLVLTGDVLQSLLSAPSVPVTTSAAVTPRAHRTPRASAATSPRASPPPNRRNRKKKERAIGSSHRAPPPPPPPPPPQGDVLDDRSLEDEEPSSPVAQDRRSGNRRHSSQPQNGMSHVENGAGTPNKQGRKRKEKEPKPKTYVPRNDPDQWTSSLARGLVSDAVVENLISQSEFKDKLGAAVYDEKQFATELLTLIHTDKEFVKDLHRAYLSKL